MTADPPTRHVLHDAERSWTETNCYVDLWIQVLDRLGHDPVPALAVALSTDFDGEQWSFLKPQPEDLRELYGIEVAELNVWRPLPEHLREHLDRGRLLTVEVDAFWLPDTAGVSYRLTHTKTTVAVTSLDPAATALGYVHGTSAQLLTGADLQGLLAAVMTGLPPYVEVVRLDRPAPDPRERTAVAAAVAARHLARRPLDDPAGRFADQLRREVATLPDRGLEVFHQWAFGTCRQFGASAELAADVCESLDRGTGVDSGAAGPLRSAARAAKSLQFALARAARGRHVDVEPLLGPLADGWRLGLSRAAEHHGG